MLLFSECLHQNVFSCPECCIDLNCWVNLRVGWLLQSIQLNYSLTSNHFNLTTLPLYVSHLWEMSELIDCCIKWPPKGRDCVRGFWSGHDSSLVYSVWTLGFNEASAGRKGEVWICFCFCCSLISSSLTFFLPDGAKWALRLLQIPGTHRPSIHYLVWT